MRSALFRCAVVAMIAGCDLPATTDAYAFDFTGTILPIDVAGPGIPVSHTSAWLGPSARARFAIPAEVDVADPEARTDVAARIVSALVTERLAEICAAPVDDLTDAERTVSQQLCAARPGETRRPREHCLQLTQVLAASMPGLGLALPPIDPTRPATCGSTSVRFARGPVDDSGALTLRVASAPASLTASPGVDRVELELGRGRYRSVVIETAAVVPLGVADDVRIEPGGCPAGTSPAIEAPDACRIAVLIGIRDPSEAPRTISLRVRVRTIDERGRASTFTLANGTTLPVRWGTLDLAALRPSTTSSWRTRVSGASVFLRPLQPSFAMSTCGEPLVYDPEVELLVDGIQITSWVRLEPEREYELALRRTMFFRHHEQPLLTRQGFGTSVVTLSSGSCR